MKDIHATISGDRLRVEGAMDALLSMPGYKASFIVVDGINEEKGEIVVAISLLNELSDACIDCDHFKHREKDPAARCALGHDCLNASEECPSRSTQVADEAFGPTIVEEEELPPSKFDELDLSPIRKVPFDEAFENQAVAHFKAEMCLDDWESYSLDEKEAIIREMESTEKEAMDAMYRELMAMPPEKRCRAIEVLAMNGPNDIAWWRNFLATWEL